VTTIKRISLLLALGACLAAAGCGSGDDEGAPIPADQAAALERELQSVQDRLDEGSVGACEDVFRHPTDPNQQPVEDILASLPQRVDPDVRDALQQSFDNLWSLVERECEDKAANQSTQPEPAPEPEPTTTETPTETTETTPPPPTETETPTNPDEQTLPEEGDGDNDGIVPESNGGGGVGPGASKEKKKDEVAP
jgi:hypothetical protein